MHWVNAVVMLVMITSGWGIYDDDVIIRGFHFSSFWRLGDWAAWSINWHFAGMWFLVINGLIYLTYGFATQVVILNDDGSFRAVLPLFWVYYPDLRPMLAKFEAYNGKNFGARMSWEELFESRMFSSRIIKSTIDNPGDNFISAYIKDPILGLLEGDNIKEKIFNYEQDLWSY